MTFTLEFLDFFLFFMWISTLGLDLLWLSDRKGGHQAEKDKAELPFKFDMNSGCALKEKKKGVSKLHHAVILEQPGA